jgi:4-hydroxybenzoate polyprenyltransferase
MAFLRLIRPINLLVIALTMYSVRIYFLPYLENQTKYENEALDYFILVFSTILIAAGGNIINDYFDVKADKVNKPEKVIIGKLIKPRWAIVTHWLFNSLAFSMACYLSWKHETFWYVFIHLFSINALWFYSMQFKRKFFIGNLLIASLTGLVPILSGIYFLDITHPYSNTLFQTAPESWLTGMNLKIFFVLFFALFATGLNLVREIIKDMEDVEGDKILRAKTIPIVWGIQKTKWLAFSLLIVLFILPIPFIMEAWQIYHIDFLIAFSPAILIVSGWLFALILLLKASERKHFKVINGLIKIIMIIGTCFPFYWHFYG